MLWRLTLPERAFAASELLNTHIIRRPHEKWIIHPVRLKKKQPVTRRLKWFQSKGLSCRLCLGGRLCYWSAGTVCLLLLLCWGRTDRLSCCVQAGYEWLNAGPTPVSCCLLVFRLTGELCIWADNPIYQSLHLLQTGVVCQLLLVVVVLKNKPFTRLARLSPALRLKPYVTTAETGGTSMRIRAFPFRGKCSPAAPLERIFALCPPQGWKTPMRMKWRHAR